MIEVRPAGPEDAALVGAIHAESWAASYARFFEPAFAAAQIADRRTRWGDRVRDGGVLLGVVDGRPLALTRAGPSPTRPGLAEVYTCFAHPDGWGTGVAATLMAATLERLAGFPAVHLWTLRDTAQSRRFYVKCGFAETGATREYDFGDGRPLPQVEFERTL